MNFKVTLSIFIGISLATISIVAFSVPMLIDHEMEHTCPIAVMSGGGCLTSGVGLAIHHLAGLQSITQSITSTSFTALVLSILVLSFLFLLLAKSLKHNDSDEHIFSQNYRIMEEPKFKLSDAPFFFWLALHNKRGIFSTAWVHGLN